MVSRCMQSLALISGVLFFTVRPVSVNKHLLPAALGALLILALAAYFGGSGLTRVAPTYILSAPA